MKVLGSEMKMVESQFDSQDKSVESLTARNSALDKSIDSQKKKIDTLKDALKNSTESFGENDRRTKNWTIQLNNAQAQLNKLERELDNYKNLLKDTNAEFKLYETLNHMFVDGTGETITTAYQVYKEIPNIVIEDISKFIEG